MALTPSNPFNNGTTAPDFTLFDTVSEKNLSLKELKGNRGTVIFFICNHCPFVIHVNRELVQLAHDYSKSQISFIAISSNDVATYPMDGPEKMKEHALKEQYPFPYLYDETQQVAKAYNAACTPDFYVFDKDLSAIYHGQLDNSRPNNGIEVTGKDIREVLEAILENKTYKKSQKPSIGCNIKWKE